MNRIIFIQPDAAEDWIESVKILLDKLGVTYLPEDAKRFCSTPDGDSVMIAYTDESIDAVLDNLDKCYYLDSTKLDDSTVYKELMGRTGCNGVALDHLIDKIYGAMPTLRIDKNLSKAANVLVYYSTWVNSQH